MPGRAQAALALAAAGRGAEALSLVNAGNAVGEPDCAFALGLWRIEGRLLPQDPAAARADMLRAAEAGHQPAQRIHAGFVAAGVGGPLDWPGALELLERWSAADPLAARQRALIEAMDFESDGKPGRVPAPIPLRENPEIGMIRSLFSREECKFLVQLAERRLKPATIFHEGRQRFIEDPLRQSDAAAFPLVFEWPFVRALNLRIAAATGTDIAQGEPLQLLRYIPGQQYRPHLDAVPGLDNQRELTLLVYLSDGYEGGETHFPEVDLAYRGGIGDALLFRNCGPDGRADPATRHAGLPVRSGVKLLASRWIRQRPPPKEGFGPQEAERPTP